MIQRIQSIYLLLAAIAVSVLFFIPLYQLDTALGFFSVGMFESKISSLDASVQVATQANVLPAIIAFVSIALSLITIFLFNNRTLQARLARLGLLINSVLLVVMIYAVDKGLGLLKDSVSTTDYNFVAFAMPLLAIILSFLASKAIIKDENLVRSADRLR